MVQDTIKCPKCGETIKLSQAISRDIEEDIRKKLEKQVEDQVAGEVKKFKAKQEALEKEYALKDAESAARLAREKKQFEEKIRREASQAQATELVDLKEALSEKDELLKKASQAELDLRKNKREIEERSRQMEIEFARRIDRDRQQIIEKISQEADERHRLKDAEKDKKIADTLAQMEELRRRMEQGSQKMQGEVLEVELEDALRNEFQFDVIEAVAPGTKGGDIIQVVKTQSGRECGKILWETKRTKNWSDQWIQKLKNDKRDVKADIAVLVSEALPEGFKQFREIDGVWVTDIPSALSLSLALRVVLNRVANERTLQTGKKEKAELVYHYVTGVEFKNRVEAIFEAFTSMKNDLDSERRSMERVWSKREKQIQQVLLNVAGMYGDLEGLAGASLPAIKMLELPEAEKD